MATETQSPIRFYTTVQAAERLGVTDARIRQLCWEFVHPQQKHGHNWLLTDADIDRLRERKDRRRKNSRNVD